MRDLLVYARRHEAFDAAVGYAARLAASLHSCLTALYVAGTDADRDLDAARERAPAFEAWASSLGAAHATWMVAQGHPAALLRHVGSWHDLLVLDAIAEPQRDEKDVARIVLEAGLPCLVVPGATGSAASGDVRHQCIAVAWNGAVEAIRALHAARPLLQSAARVVVLLGEARARDRGLPPFHLEQWCDRHRLQVEYLLLPPGADSGAPILDAAASAQADLIVMGAHGRSRVSEWVLGGVTGHMLRHSPTPLFMRY